MARALQVINDFDGTAFVNGIEVAAPCDQKWEDMRGDDRVRHCDACALNVYDLRGLKAEQIQALFVESEGRRVCGRVFRRRDGTVITADCPVGLAEKAWRHARNGTLTMAAGLFTAVAFVIGLFAWMLTPGHDEASLPTGQAEFSVQVKQKPPPVVKEIIKKRNEVLKKRERPPMPGGLRAPGFDHLPEPQPHVEPDPFFD
jgi:hypothetical protein